MEVVTCRLSLPVVPAQALVERREPVGDLVLCADGRHRVDGGGHVQAVLVPQLPAVAAVERHPRGVATLLGHRDLELHPRGHHDGSEGWIMEAPAATAYAVDPVGVDTIRPSPCTEV